jgi:hypothetical protein
LQAPERTLALVGLCIATSQRQMLVSALLRSRH